MVKTVESNIEALSGNLETKGRGEIEVSLKN